MKQYSYSDVHSAYEDCQPPDDQSHVFLHLQAADEAGDNRHPQIIMADLAQKLNFKVLSWCPQSLFDGWSFWIQYDQKPLLPDYITYKSWINIGSPY